ncbi:MAG: hypothetical protein LBO05_13720, partial [Deltaproteobacteria bacterium]|nr:hypothetical protein [Deltaproteobacteria bacterium]
MTGRPPKAASRGGRAAAGAGPKVSLTPALRQYFEAKRECPGCVLFFQMGDFYELFFEDALLAAPLLDLALTSRQRLADKPVPLCGVPLQSVEGYINRLVALGHKVAVCDQSGAPGPGGGPAERRLARLVTPATVLSAEGQNPALPRYLAAAMRRDDEHVLAAVDISTGDFAVGHFTDFQTFRTALRNLEPAEILLPGTGLENPGGPAGGRDAPSEFTGGAGRDGTDAPAGPPAPAAAKEPPKTAAGAAASAAADSPGPATLADLNFYGGDAPPDRDASGDALPDAGPDGGGPERDDPAPPPGAGGPAAGREGPWPEGALISREMLDLARSLDALTTFVPAGDFDPAAGERELALAFPAGRGDRSVSAVSSAAFSSSVSADSSASSSSSSAASAASSSSASVFPARPPALSGGAATGARVVGEAPPLEGWPLLQGAAGAALRYLGNVTRGWGIRHLSQPRFLWERDYLHLDEAAVRNLELFKSLRDGGEKTTLLSQIDHTVTPMGARMLRDWLARPLIRLETVAARHEA